MPEQVSVTLRALEAFWMQVLQFLPSLGIGLVLLLVGWAMVYLLRRILVRILRLMQFDMLANRTGVIDLLLRGGIQQAPSEIAGSIVYWFLLLALSLGILYSMGLEAARDLFKEVLAYLPNVVVAIFVLFAGSAFARFLRGTFSTYLSNVGVAGADFLGKAVYTVAMIIVLFIALQQLSIGGQILRSAFEIALGGFCLAFGIAFGLAGKEWATQVLEKMWRHSR